MCFCLQKSLFEGLEEPDPTLLDTFQPRSSTKRLMLKSKVENTSSSVVEQTESDKENKDDHQISAALPENSWYVLAWQYMSDVACTLSSIFDYI